MCLRMRRALVVVLAGWMVLGGTFVRAAQAPVTAPNAASVADRSKELNALFKEIWEDRLKHNPEFASQLGDKRYNDQLSDYSAKEVNASLERGLGFIQRLGAIDTTGLPQQERLSAELMMRSLI